jgi:hypothetical protein
LSITRVKASSITQGLPKGKTALTGNSVILPGSYESIATVTVSTAVSSVTFSSIPSTYKHLQIRAMHLYSNTGDNMVCSYNSGSFNNVYSHFIYGEGTTATASNNTAPIISFQSGSTSTSFCAAIYDFLDYTNTNKNKTMRGLLGQDVNGSGIVGFLSALATNTAAINALTFTYNGGANFVAKTTFALYGIK